MHIPNHQGGNRLETNGLDVGQSVDRRGPVVPCRYVIWIPRVTENEEQDKVMLKQVAHHLLMGPHVQWGADQNRLTHGTCLAQGGEGINRIHLSQHLQETHGFDMC